MKQRSRTVFDIEELKDLSKDGIRELVEEDRYRNISNFLGGEILKMPKSASKDSMLDMITEHFYLDEKQIKKLSKDHLVQLAKLLDIVFYRGRFRMKAEDATKDNLINKILIEKKNKALENQRMAISVTESEILGLFGDYSSEDE